MRQRTHTQDMGIATRMRQLVTLHILPDHTAPVTALHVASEVVLLVVVLEVATVVIHSVRSQRKHRYIRKSKTLSHRWLPTLSVSSLSEE